MEEINDSLLTFAVAKRFAKKSDQVSRYAWSIRGSFAKMCTETSLTLVEDESVIWTIHFV